MTEPFFPLTALSEYSSKLKRVGIENPVAVVLLKRRVPSSTFRR
jgi:hypothetical protein